MLSRSRFGPARNRSCRVVSLGPNCGGRSSASAEKLYVSRGVRPARMKSATSEQNATIHITRLIAFTTGEGSAGFLAIGDWRLVALIFLHQRGSDRCQFERSLRLTRADDKEYVRPTSGF